MASLSLSPLFLKIILLNMGPNLLQSLGARSLGGTHKGLHLRRYFSRLHDAAGLRKGVVVVRRWLLRVMMVE
ncbi:hypothetical protein ACFX13_028730 [Malus domestica]